MCQNQDLIMRHAILRIIFDHLRFFNVHLNQVHERFNIFSPSKCGRCGGDRTCDLELSSTMPVTKLLQWVSLYF